MRTIARLVLLGLLLASVVSYGQETVLSKAVRACAHDIDTFCAKVQPGQGRIIGCLYANGERISERCGMALNEASLAFDKLASQAEEVYHACETERQAFCPTANWGDGEVVKCLAMQSHTMESVSAACRLALEKHGVI